MCIVWRRIVHKSFLKLGQRMFLGGPVKFMDAFETESFAQRKLNCVAIKIPVLFEYTV
jgi:hypothetical protein